LEIQFVFTANPEDYTNRGSIVTPLKDRIDSQIITHYPKDLSIGRLITQQEANLKEEQIERVDVNDALKDLVEQIAVEARDSEFVDAKSGVSARLTISAYETLVSSAEHRALRNNEAHTYARISDLYNVIPAITGKVELVYEGEQEGAGIVAGNLIGKAVRTQFLNYFPNPEEIRKKKSSNPFQSVIDWFGKNHVVDFDYHLSDKDYEEALLSIPGLEEIVNEQTKPVNRNELLFMMELALHGLAEYSMLSKSVIESGLSFKDLLSSMFSMPDIDHDEDDY
jgi:magnesium chelatase subunit I